MRKRHGRKSAHQLPDSAKVGDVIEVKTLIPHVMETGNRHDKHGKLIPRDIINTFVAKYGDTEVFRAEFGPGISANPFVSFRMRVPGPASSSSPGPTITASRRLRQRR